MLRLLIEDMSDQLSAALAPPKAAFGFGVSGSGGGGGGGGGVVHFLAGAGGGGSSSSAAGGDGGGRHVVSELVMNKIEAMGRRRTDARDHLDADGLIALYQHHGVFGALHGQLTRLHAAIVDDDEEEDSSKAMVLDFQEDDFMDPNKWPCLSAIAKCFSALCKGGDDLLTSQSGRGRLIMVFHELTGR